MKLYLAIAAVLLSLCIGLYLSLSSLFTARSALSYANAQIKVAEAQAEAYSLYRSDAQQVLQEASINEAAIETSLEQNKDWGSTAVPNTVVAGLCKNSLCKTGDVQASRDQPKH